MAENQETPGKVCPGCGERCGIGASICPVCASPLEVPQVATAPGVSVTAPAGAQVTVNVAPVTAAAPSQAMTQSPLPGEPFKKCPQCGKSFDPSSLAYQDGFCECGGDLKEGGSAPAPSMATPAIAAKPAAPAAKSAFDEPKPAEPAKPPPGSLVVTVFHDTEPRAVHYHRVETDIVMIGREDPKQEVFPDVDVSRLASAGVAAAHVSRKHARIFRAQEDGQEKYYIFPFKGSTGTQLNKTLLTEGVRAEIKPGDRLVLGTKVRMKFERL